METQSTEMQTMNVNDAMMQTLFNPQAFEQMQRASGLFAKSGLVPATFKDNMPACFVGLQLAAQLGVNPFMLFQKIYVVGGKIGIEAQVAIAVANQRGVFDGPIEHTFSGEKNTRSCTATATLARSKKPVTLTIEWSTVEAEGWLKNQKWKSMPDQMFRYRTSLWLIRTYAPETLMGLNSIDELEDVGVINITPAKTSNGSGETIAEKLEKAKTKPIETVAEPVTEKPAAPKNPFEGIEPKYIAKARGALKIGTDIDKLTADQIEKIIITANEIKESGF